MTDSETPVGNLTLRTFIVLCIAITLGAFGQVFLKMGLGAQGIPPGRGLFETVGNIALAMLRPKVMLGLVLYVTSTFFWLTAVSRVRLSVAYPMISLSYPLVVVLSAVILHEQVKWGCALAGLFFICSGVSFIGIGLGRMGESRKECTSR
ncbi:MAG: hypothetical protein QHI38_01380 [Armatimonadota bacterium]|nr:hypothetical protein [Armatimonadota bacterium]